MTETAENHTLWARTYLCIPYSYIYIGETPLANITTEIHAGKTPFFVSY